MPNAKVLTEKQAIVAGLVERIKASGSGVFVDYKGITVADDTALRAKLRNDDIEYSVIKNTLCRRAIEEVGLTELDPILNGTTSLATTAGDPIAPFRVISEYADRLGKDMFNIKAGFMEGRVLSMAEISELSKLSSKEALYAKLLGTMLAPISALAVVLGQIVEQGGGTVSAAPAETAEAPAEPATEAEAPVAETEAPAEAEAPVEAEAPAEPEAPVEAAAEEPAAAETTAEAEEAPAAE